MTSRNRTSSSPARNESGQTIILVAVMVLSFLMFFGFTVNTGVLINAKISVQAAADAAAYAGAATQARQLSAISYLNYDMRRQFKKFLFRNVMVGSLGNPKFPKNSDGGSTSPYDFPKFTFETGSPKLKALKVPVICIPVTSKANNDQCTTLNIRDTAFDLNQRLGNLSNFGGPILQELLRQTGQLQNIQEASCAGQSVVNLLALKSWLFRGEIDDSYVNSQLPGNSNAELQGTLKSLLKGLGLFPRNILHLMRIETLKEFLNSKPQNVTGDEIEAMEKNDRIAERQERTILAFKSALSNLNTTVFDPEKLVMEELNPEKMVELETVTADIDVFIQLFDETKNKTEGLKCNSHIFNKSLFSIPVGVKRVPIAGRNVVYGVRVRAKVRPRGLLFLPFGEELELEAVAGAKPFGSRIGPADLSGQDFILNGSPTDLSSVKVNNKVICKPDSPPNHKCNVPNINLLAGTNFFDTLFLEELSNKIGKPASTANILKAQYYAMAPNPVEVGHYNILPPPPVSRGDALKPQMGDELISTYDGREIPAINTPPVYRFYAPIYPANSSVDISTYVERFMKATLPATIADDFGSGEEIRTQTLAALKRYIDGPLQSGADSEYQETVTFAAIEHPMAWLDRPGKTPFWLTRGDEVRSSWSPYGKPPRFSYSVRFVALRDLVSQGISNQDSEFDSVSH